MHNKAAQLCAAGRDDVRFCNLIDWSLYGRDFVHTCLWHGPLNSTRCLFVYGRAVQVLLTVQYTRTHIM